MNIYDEFINQASTDEIIKYFSQDTILPTEVQRFNSRWDYYNNIMPARSNTPNLSNFSNNKYNIVKKIIDFKSQFLFGKGVELINDSPEFEAEFEKFKKSWENSKLSSHYVQLAISLFSYGKAAEIIQLDEKGEVNHLPLIAGKDGQSFYAFFDNDGSLGAFSRYYNIKELDSGKIKDIPIAEIYTNSYKYIFEKKNGWQIKQPPEEILKMPVVFYSQKMPVTYQIKDLQDNYNEILNELSDVNSQIAYPFLLMIGDLLNLAYKDNELQEYSLQERQKKIADKLNSGALKVALMEGDSDMRFLNWDSEPKTLLYEIENLKDLMYKLTSTPDLSLENIKSITNISGLALQILFLDSEISKQGDFSNFFEMKRALNLHSYYLGTNNLSLSAETISFLPQETKEIITNLALSVQNGLISQETAVSSNPLVSNPVFEIEKIKEQNEIAIQMPQAESFNEL